MDEKKYAEALNYRPQTIKNLFPDSQALIVSGKVVQAALLKMRTKGQKALAIAANGRSDWIIEGVLNAAHKTNSVVIIEIAKSELDYCDITMKSMVEKVNNIINKNNLKVVVAVHADHYAIKNDDDLAEAFKEIPGLFDSGITSIAIDASHLPPDENIFTNIKIAEIIPSWISLETEVGEIKGELGLSTTEEALFHIQALNAYGVFPTWIALNNGSVHGLETTGGGLDVELTSEIHNAIEKYGVDGAQHGTSGNNFDKLRNIVKHTNTTKANVATALQMISWGVKVNEYGNAVFDSDNNLTKLPDHGVSDETWKKMVAIANENGWDSSNYQNLNLAANSLLNEQPQEIQQRMIDDVERFATNLIKNVFTSSGSAEHALDIILSKKSHDIDNFNTILESKAKWTTEYIQKEGKILFDKQPVVEGNFDD